MNLLWQVSPALLQEDPTLSIAPILFSIFVWGGVVAVAISVVVIVGILISEIRRNKVW